MKTAADKVTSLRDAVERCLVTPENVEERASEVASDEA